MDEMTNAVAGAITVLKIGQIKRNLAQLKNALDIARKELAKTRASYGSVAAGYAAFRQALERVDPEHPLVIDDALRQRLGKAGEKAVAQSGELSSAKDAGIVFPIPQRPNGEPLDVVQYRQRLGELFQRLERAQDENRALQSKVEALESAHGHAVAQLVDSVSVRAALHSELKRQAPESALITNAPLLERISAAGQAVYDQTGDLEAVYMEGASFLLPTAKGVGGRNKPGPEPISEQIHQDD